MRKLLKTVISENVQKVTRARGLNTVSLAKKSGVNQATISRLFKERDDLTDAKVSTLDGCSEALGIPAWKFVYPSLPLNLIESKDLEKLISLLSECPSESAERVLQTAIDLARLEKLKD